MDRAYVASLVDRDWELIARMKTAAWIERKAAMTPAQALALGDELRRYVRSVRPDWPRQADRDADLACHARVSEALQRVAKP